MSKVPISVIVTTKNEEKNIRQCLESIMWADEIFIVDSQSEDATLDIAGEYTDKIYQFHCDGRLPKKKNWALRNMPFSYDWVLLLDADEIAPQSLEDEVRELLKNNRGCSAFVSRFDCYFLGKPIKHGDPTRKLVFFKHNKASYEELDDFGLEGRADVEVHEHQIIDGKIGFLKSRIMHNDRKNLFHYFNRHNRYSSWEAHLIYKNRYNEDSSKNIAAKTSGSWLNTRRLMKNIFLKLPFKPLIYFIYGYFIRLGFLDGYPGFAYNMCKAFYAFQISLKVRELKKGQK